MDAVATTWSQRTAEAVMKRQPIVSDHWDYRWGVVLKGIEAVWRATGDARYFDYVKRNVDHFVGANGEIGTYRMADHNIDHLNPGKLLFALQAGSGDQRYRRAADVLREQLRTQPRTESGGFWHKRMYPDQMWLDGIYMGCPFYAEHASGAGEAAAFDDIVHQITLIFEHTREPKTGLLYHGWDESRTQAWADPRTGCSRSFWSRAIGWYAMALADVLDILPEERQRATVAAIFRETMAGVARAQDESGLWYQVLDQGGRAGNYLESSASCMFAYAFAKGARQGHLPADRRQLAARAYEAILDRFARTLPGGEVTFEGTCRGAGLGPAPVGKPYRDGSFEYYVAQPVVTNDDHGVGAFLLASVELERAAG
jgi:unsaturated rhamnogalacturonyl hydrolase